MPADKLNPSSLSFVTAECLSTPRSPEDTISLTRKLIEWWQPYFNLLDTEFHITYNPDFSAVYTNNKASNGDNPYIALIKIGECAREQATRVLWHSAAHELAHVVCWPLWFSSSVLEKHVLTPHQYDLLIDIEKPGYEATAYKIERIVCGLVQYPGDKEFD